MPPVRLVQLKNHDISVTSPVTGWSISCAQKKLTPIGHDPHIQTWIDNGALNVLDSDPYVEKFQELLGATVDDLSDAQAKSLCENVNELAGAAICAVGDTSLANKVESLRRFQNQLLVASGKSVKAPPAKPDTTSETTEKPPVNTTPTDPPAENKYMGLREYDLNGSLAEEVHGVADEINEFAGETIVVHEGKTKADTVEAINAFLDRVAPVTE